MSKKNKDNMNEAEVIAKRGKIFAVVGVLILTVGFGSWLIISNITKNEEVVPEESTTTESTEPTQTYSPEHRSEVLVSTGIDTARVRLDEQAANQLFGTIFTWADGVTYNAARDVLFEHTSEENANRIMPENVIITPAMISTLTHDTWYIDLMHVNSEFISAQYAVSDYDEETQVYHYISIVTINSTSEDGNEGQTQCVITFDTDVNNNITNMEYDAIR